MIFLLVRLQLHAVCHLWAKTTSNLSVGGIDSEHLLMQLAEYGVAPTEDAGMLNSVSLPAAAQQVGAVLAGSFVIETAQAQIALRHDLSHRLLRIIGVMDEVRELGMSEERIAFALHHAEFWDKHGADEEMFQLQMQSDLWERRNEPQTEALREEMAAANDKRNQRYSELRRAFEPQATPARIVIAADQLESITAAKSLAHSLDVYRSVDEDLAPLETYVPEVIRTWDELNQQILDRARGK